MHLRMQTYYSCFPINLSLQNGPNIFRLVSIANKEKRLFVKLKVHLGKMTLSTVWFQNLLVRYQINLNYVKQIITGNHLALYNVIEQTINFELFQNYFFSNFFISVCPMNLFGISHLDNFLNESIKWFEIIKVHTYLFAR